MTKNENLLVTLMEECAELQQAVSKALRFGMDGCRPGSPDRNNEHDIMVEYYQLVAVMEMLNNDNVLHMYDDYDHCYECSAYGDDYYIDDDGELVCYCPECQRLFDDEWYDDEWD